MTVFFLQKTGREPAGFGTSVDENEFAKFESYVVKGAHRGDAPQMGIYNPVNPASIYTIARWCFFLFIL